MFATDRRTFLLGASATALSACATAAPEAPIGPPVARLTPTEDTYFGVTVTDNYRWMENPEDPEWLPFLRGQNAYARSILDSMPGRAGLLRRISANSGETVLTRGVRQAGGFFFYEQRPLGADNYKLFVRDVSGQTRVLIDPTQMSEGGSHVSLDWWSPSNDGAHLAYGLSPAGSEASVLHVMNVATGEVLPERIEKTDAGVTAWLPDGSGFYYVMFTGERGEPTFYLDAQARLHMLGDDPANDVIALKRGLYAEIPMSEEQTPYIGVAPSAGVAFAYVADVRTEYACWATSLDSLRGGHPAWRKICDFDDLVTADHVVGDQLYLLSNKDAIRGKVLRTSARAPSLAAAHVVLPEGSIVLEGLAGTRSEIIVRTLDGGVSGLKRIRANDAVDDIALPFEGSISEIDTAYDRDEAFILLGGWLTPRDTWRYDPAAPALTKTNLSPPPPIDVAPYEAQRIFVAARDGVQVPVTILRRRDAQPGQPCFVMAYGAYQIVMRPSFSTTLLAFLDEGVTYVVAHVRGGGEYGREWHEAGKRATKPNTWRDLIDVCDDLVRQGIAVREKLAINGGSAGGVTVGRAMTERPDLCSAVISNVGWSNCLRYVAEQNSFGEIEEWGSIDDEQGFRDLYEIDSYVHVQDGVNYPAVMFTTGATDPRVAPFHAAKMAARMQAANPNGNPVLLRVDFDAGHGIGSTRTQADELSADNLAFALWQAGAPNFQPT